MTNLDHLETLAREAKWVDAWSCVATRMCETSDGEELGWCAIASCHVTTGDEEYDKQARTHAEADAAFIRAASPDVVLGLIAEVRRLRTVANVAEQRCREAVPQWAPELRAALAAWRSLRGEP